MAQAVHPSGSMHTSSIFGGIQNAVRNLTLTSSRTIRSVPRTMPSVMATPSEAPMPDKLFSSIELEYRGHDPEVLKSYTNVCNHLNLTRGRFKVFPYVRWIQPALRSKFVHKKYKLHYETRTHITVFEMIAWSEKELDEITDEFLSMMLGEQDFLDRWAVNVKAEIAARAEEGVSGVPEGGKEAVTNVTKRQDTLVPILEELTHALDASSHMFLSSVDLIICHCEPEHNRDASLLFAVRLQIDRIASSKVDRNRYSASARRLLQLIRLSQQGYHYHFKCPISLRLPLPYVICSTTFVIMS
ncbi:hypothetical protein KIN20_000490 [Parelaphostrongylus tenuis]|uniref:Small ribosomal subunit protein uS10m n=1 Tax=Parelaphostrongylus tenuis TaxID=148309 RepID=A0AAD5QDX8_PARTN|nr:hypothetical protein KIN20_000490 [Parelaphostrongylus tenuis]